MAPLKIAVSLDNVPQMLCAIVLEALQREPQLQPVPLHAGAETPAVDTWIVSGLAEPEASLRSGRMRRLVDIDADGRRATVHCLQHASWQVHDLSPDKLVALLREQQPAPPLRAVAPVAAGRWRQALAGWLKRAPAALPAPPVLPALPAAPAQAAPTLPAPTQEPDGATLELARLAARMLAARARSLPAADAGADAGAGPAGELAALARELAAAALTGAPAPSTARLPGMAQAARCFGLRDDESDLLLLAALVEVDPRAARLVALLNDHMGRTRPTLGLVQDLGGQLSAVLERLVAEGPLMRLGLVTLEGGGPLSTQAVKVSDAVWPLLLGLQRRAPFALCRLEPQRLAALPLPAAARDACAQAAAAAAQRNASEVLLIIVGDPGVGRCAMAQAIAAQWRTVALVVPATTFTGPETIAEVAREALWANAAVIVTRADALDTTLWRQLTERLPAPLLVTAEPQRLAALAPASARRVLEVQAPLRDAAQRLRLWQARAPVAWPLPALQDLAERFDFGAAQIEAALGLARSRLDSRANTQGGAPAGAASGSEADAAAQPATLLQPADARAACETLRETRFAGTAERIDCPFEPGDIILRAETRRELDLAIAWARHARRVFHADGAGAALRAGGGLACLFSGPPGGGKTMAAQILARQVDHALFRVDLSQVVDKFIGESEKKLAALFDEAERARVALFFDEADALFGKRTEVRDAHDRYANITVDFLLQRMESFTGLVILATNLAANIDDAFLRRTRVRATFLAPDPADRRRIWDKLLPALARRDSDIDIARLADPFELMGGEIRNAIYTAHLLAAEEDSVLAMRHCVAGLWRELGKTGRISNLAHLGPWKSAVLAV